MPRSESPSYKLSGGALPRRVVIPSFAPGPPAPAPPRCHHSNHSRPEPRPLRAPGRSPHHGRQVVENEKGEPKLSPPEGWKKITLTGYGSGRILRQSPQSIGSTTGPSLVCRSASGYADSHRQDRAFLLQPEVLCQQKVHVSLS